MSSYTKPIDRSAHCVAAKSAALTAVPGAVQKHPGIIGMSNIFGMLVRIQPVQNGLCMFASLRYGS